MDARLEPYRTLVSFLGEALGPDYEVVLHDLTSEEGTIAAIVNNNISGRTEGAPLSNMALRFIHGKVYENQPYVAGYQGASQAKGRLRSSTMFIKDGRRYHLPSKQLQSRMACKSGMNFQGRPIHFDLVDDWGYPIPQEDLYVPHFRANCETCGSKLICNGCSDCGKCL